MVVVIASCMGARQKVQVDDSFAWLIHEAEYNEDFESDVATEGTRAFKESERLHEVVEKKSKLEWVDCVLTNGSEFILYEE